MDARTPELHWSSHYESGNESVDQQHESVFVLANQLLDEAAVFVADNPMPLRTSFDALINYVAGHFRDEEEFLRTIGSDKVDCQSREHHALLASLTGILPAADAPVPNDLGACVMGWVHNEFLPHIQDSDMEAVQLARYSSVAMETNDQGQVERFEMIYDVTCSDPT